jgi:putative transposase
VSGDRTQCRAWLFVVFVVDIGELIIHMVCSMSLPRQILPGRFYAVTRRCVNRDFLLRPDEETNNAYLYCLIQAAKHSNMAIVAAYAASNHHHPVIYDADGRVPEFTQYMHLQMARSQNRLRGRDGYFWSSGGPSVVELVAANDVRRAVVYALTNPVKDFLVDKVVHWPGVNTWGAMKRNEPLRATRPRHFFSDEMEKEVALELSVPHGHGLGSREEFVAAVARDIAAVEEDCAKVRHDTGRRVLGRKAVLRQSPSSSPAPVAGSPSGLRNKISPRIKCSSKCHRIEALLRNRQFIAAHRQARVAWLAGLPFEFPTGTYALRHLVNPDARVIKPDRPSATTFAG